MPIYEYRCDCGVEIELILSIREGEEKRYCACGGVMQRKLSAPSLVNIRQTGRGMALDTLNDKRDGMPNKWWKSGAEKNAASGLEPLPRRVY